MSCPNRASEVITKNLNPEVFKIKPRVGGYVPINVEAPPSPHDDFNVKEKISKEFRVQTALDETQSYDSEDATAPNPLKDAMYMFGVTISTIMMMAAEQTDISPEYLTWTRHCLECVKDDFGNHPPNVQGILNQMKGMAGSSGDGAPGGDGNTGDNEQTIRTTTTVKMPEDEEEETK